MKYKKYSEQELKEMAIIPEGTYQFETMEVHEVDKYGVLLQDRNGNDMAKLKLKIWDKEGRERTVYTNLFGDGRMAFRTRHYADSIGEIESYEDETFSLIQTIGAVGYCEVIVRKARPKDDGSGESWPESNDVRDFVKKDDQQKYRGVTAAKPAPAHDFASDDVPF